MLTGRYVMVNRRMCEIAGRTEEEMLADTFPAMTHPDDRHLHEEKAALLAAGKIGYYTLEKRYIRKDRGIVWADVTVSPLWKPGRLPGEISPSFWTSPSASDWRRSVGNWKNGSDGRRRWRP